MKKISTVTVLMLLIAALGGASYLNRQIVKPLEKVNREAKRFAAENSGAENTSLENISHIREIRELGCSIEKMEHDTLGYMDHLTTITAEDLAHAEDNPEIRDGMEVVMAGIITHKKTMITKKGTMMAFIQVEDLYGEVEVIVFPNVYEQGKAWIREDGIIVVKGTVNFKEDEAPKVLANKIYDLQDCKPSDLNDDHRNYRPAKPVAGTTPTIRPADDRVVKIVIPRGTIWRTALTQLGDILKRYKGDVPVWILVEETGQKLKTNPDMWVEPSEYFYAQVKALLGPDCFR